MTFCFFHSFLLFARATWLKCLLLYIKPVQLYVKPICWKFLDGQLPRFPHLCLTWVSFFLVGVSRFWFRLFFCFLPLGILLYSGPPKLHIVSLFSPKTMFLCGTWPQQIAKWKSFDIFFWWILPMFPFLGQQETCQKYWRNHEDEAKSMLQATECLLCGDAGHVRESHGLWWWWEMQGDPTGRKAVQKMWRNGNWKKIMYIYQ